MNWRKFKDMDIFTRWAIGILVTVIIALSSYFTGVNADQDDEIDKKVPIDMMLRYEAKNEKAHDELKDIVQQTHAEQIEQGKDVREIKTILQERFPPTN